MSPLTHRAPELWTPTLRPALALLLLSLLVFSAESRQSSTVFHIPRNARPGQIVGVINEDHRHSQAHLVHSPGPHRPQDYFRVSSNGLLVVTANVTAISGKTLRATIQHQALWDTWKQEVYLEISPFDSKLDVVKLVYVGEIPENQPVGTQVGGLEDLEYLVKAYSDCEFSILTGDITDFTIVRPSATSLHILSKSVFDREMKASYSFVLKAKCPDKTQVFVTVEVSVSDVNDNSPEFATDMYTAVLKPADLTTNRHFLQVFAIDEDLNDKVLYSLTPSVPFHIDPHTGQFSITDPSLLTDDIYQFQVFAHDKAGNHGSPATIHVVIDTVVMEMEEEEDFSVHSVQKREIFEIFRDDRGFVVRDENFGDLFSVAPIPPVEGERYYFMDPAPENLTLDSVTGMISRESEHVWNGSVESFMVNITMGEVVDEMLVTVYVEYGLDWQSPILSNEPRPLTARVPIWIRPYTTVFTAQARITEQYGVEVVYKIESGAEGRFYMDSSTGEVKVQDRAQFEVGYEYSLAISAETAGNARSLATPAQIVRLQVDDIPPQFYLNPYIVSVSETSASGTVVGNITAKSFQELPQSYVVDYDDPSDSALFSINAVTGAVTLESDLVYIQQNRFQYRGVATSTEETSLITNNVELIINLEAENLHVPFFPAEHHVRTGLSEDVSSGTSVLEVLAVDLDPGDLGYLDFTVNSPNFEIISTDGKTGTLQTVGDLDYDRIGPEHKYEFTIVASDRDPVSPRSGTATVEVYMDNVDDEAPEFYPPNQQVFVTEFTPQSTEFVYFVQAYDPDHPTGGQLVFSFINEGDCSGGSATSCDIFNLDQNTGKLTLSTDVPGGKENVLLLFSVDDGTSTTEGNVTVNFVGVNNPPIFPECNSYLYTVAIEEGEPANTPIINITAIDNDAGVNGQLQLSIVPDFRYDEFFVLNQIDNNNAELISNMEFDREDPENGVVLIDGEVRYRVTVLAEDEGNPTLSTTCFFFVTILDRNDNPPRFDDQSYEIHMLAVPDETEFLRVFAVDDDQGQNAEVRYSIESQPPACEGNTECFTIDDVSGWISLVGTIPAGTPRIEFEVRAEDQGLVPQSSTVMAVVVIETEQSNLPPQWQRLPGGDRIDDVDNLALLENVTLNTRLDITLETEVPGDPNAARTYIIVRGRTDLENGAVDFNSRTVSNQMEIYTAGNLQYERVSEYSLKLRVSRQVSGATYSDARLRVGVEDVNDKVPEFQGLDRTGRYPAAVSGQTSDGDLVVRVIAIDLDGTSPNNLVTYYFDAACTDCAEFRLDTGSGEIEATGSYDRETKPEYILQVWAQDSADSSTGGGPNRASTEVIVQVLGTSTASPGFTEARYQFPSVEGRPLFTDLATVTAFDPDPEFNYPQYMISEGNEDHLFAVDTTNGTIYNTGYLMYLEQESYVFTYSVFDGRNINKTQVIINVTSANIFPPVFAQDTYENSDHTEETDLTDSLLLADASATDPDPSRPADIVYSIEGALTGDGDFQIDQDTGQVFLLQPGNLDRDYPNGYSNWQFNLVAEDEGTSPDTRKGYAVMNVLLTDINDNAPIFNPCCFEGSVQENEPSGTTVMTLVADDYDAGANADVTYELLLSPDGAFDVSDAGVVTTTRELDREAQDKYEILVRARDNGSPPLYSADNQTIYITVTDANDNAPAFIDPPYAIDMPEEIPVDGSVTEIPAEDLDIGDNAKLDFEIDSGDDDDNFYFDDIYVGKSGVLKIAKRVDYDTLPEPKTITLQISVSDPDNPGINSPQTLEINVLDINDNAPAVDPPVVDTSFDEDEPIGFSVAAFTYTDPDTGPGGEATFSIDYENTDPEKKFAVDPVTGEVTTRNLLDREQQEYYTVHVLATDQGEPPMTGTGTLQVTLNDINDNAPDFDPDLPPVIVGAATTNGQEVARFTAVDADTWENGPPFTFEYDCNDASCGDFTFDFLADENNGTGILRANRDGYNRYDLNRKQYDLGIKMTDNPQSGQPSMSATRILPVVIESLNDRPMEEAGSSKGIVVYNYNTAFDNVQCGSVYVNDPDDWDLPDKTFTCREGCLEDVEGTVYEYFIVDSDLGDITMRAGTPLGPHTLLVEVYDQEWGQTITATVNINIQYIYDDAIKSSGSMRLSATTSKDLIRREAGPSKLEQFRTELAGLLGVAEANVDIFSVMDVPDTQQSGVDVEFAAHGSPYYTSARMSGLVLANKQQIETSVGITIERSPVDLCFIESCFGSGCDNRIVTYAQPSLINTNTTSYVGVNSTYDYSCDCRRDTYTEMAPVCEAYSCYNDGQCVETWNGFSCNCLPGFEGPRCQSTHISLDGNSWAWFETLGAFQCPESRLSLEFSTTSPTGLLLYNGPLTDPTDQLNVPDFLAVWLEGGFVRARVNLGEGEVDLEVTGATGASQLNDGNWHTVEVITEDKTLRLIVDHCLDSDVDEDINDTSAERGVCESRVDYPGESVLLSVLAPLELGGRSNPTYPTNIPTEGFNGCIKNLRYNDELYDLTVSRTQTGGSPSNDCTRELGCAVPDACPINSTCIGNFNNDNKQCVCDPGWRGPNCDIETPVKDIETDPGFIEWELKPEFNNSVLSNRSLSIQLQFRSRQPQGMLFTASSFSKLEHLKLDLVESRLRFRYDLGSDERDLWLTFVNASDGLWHVVTIHRYGNQVILKMDHGEGKYYNESLPNEEHQLMSMYDSQETYGGAEVYYKKYIQDPIVTEVLVSSCVNDIRVDDVWFPMSPGDDESEAAIVIQDPNTVDTCESNACDAITCPAGQFCEDRWRMPYCVCPFGERLEGGVCVPITDCSIPRCNFGYCVVTSDGMWRCVCDEGWSGVDCNEPAAVIQDYVVSITEGAIAAIVICLLVLLLLLLIVIFCVLRKTQKDPLLVDPEDDTRENMVYYDEEGAGEEDMHAYDLSRLQKPMGPPEVVMVTSKPPPPNLYSEAPHLQAAAPEPMHAPRSPLPPVDHPHVGRFIITRIEDADNDPNAPPYDSVREYEYEGNGSTAGTLSSIQTSSSGDLDFDYLIDYGPSFEKLADIYGAGKGGVED